MKKHVTTDFRKFIIEKLNHDEKKIKNEDELDDELDDTIEDELPEVDKDDEDEINDDLIDELLTEYKKIKKQHELHKLSRRKK